MTVMFVIAAASVLALPGILDSNGIVGILYRSGTKKGPGERGPFIWILGTTVAID
jgi:hypothetical protein